MIQSMWPSTVTVTDAAERLGARVRIARQRDVGGRDRRERAVRLGQHGAHDAVHERAARLAGLEGRRMRGRLEGAGAGRGRDRDLGVEQAREVTCGEQEHQDDGQEEGQLDRGLTAAQPPVPSEQSAKHGVRSADLRPGASTTRVSNRDPPESTNGGALG